jgi:AcrR family transcriptional regulator
VPDQELDDLWPPLSGPGPGAFALRKLHEAAARGGPRPSLDALQRLQEQAASEQRQRGRGRGRGRPGPSLSRAEIVDAAIAVADAEGAEAVSMRRIAQVLRAGTMSLYWHVANKEQLLDLMLDTLVAETEVPKPSGDWRADLRELARSRRAMLRRHLWVMDFIGGRPPLGPNTLLDMEQALAILDDAGLDTVTSLRVLETVLTYVMGAVLREMREMRTDREQEQAGITKEEWEPMMTGWRDRLAADGRFSRVVGFLDENVDPDGEETRDERFEFGLDCVIDGMTAALKAAADSATGGNRTR